MTTPVLKIDQSSAAGGDSACSSTRAHTPSVDARGAADERFEEQELVLNCRNVRLTLILQSWPDRPSALDSLEINRLAHLLQVWLDAKKLRQSLR